MENPKEDARMQEEVRSFVMSLCSYAGENEEFGEDFLKRLTEDEEVYQEFLSYMRDGNFAGKVNIKGYTVVDILIWQMDHFRARLDRDNSGTKQNGDRMVLLSFDTFLKMRKEPEVYLQKLQGETGTDFLI